MARKSSLGASCVDRKGSFMQATILTDITPDNPAYRQEFFGPVALMFAAKDEEEAIAIANDSPYGLGGSIYTKNIDHGKRVASRIETGMVFINYPFGEHRGSAFRRDQAVGATAKSFLISGGIQEFREQKADLRLQRILSGRIGGSTNAPVHRDR